MKYVIMRKIEIAVLWLLLIALVPGCSASPNDHSATKEDAKTLIWVIPGLVRLSSGDDAPGQQWREAVDEALRRKGADFTVRFLPVGSIIDGYVATGGDGLWYAEKILQMMESGEQVDLFYMGGTPASGDWYMRAWQAGASEPLDEWLESGSARVVYEKYPQTVWDAMRINGSIHGLYKGIAVGLQYGVQFYDERLSEHPINRLALTGDISSLMTATPDGITPYARITGMPQEIAGMLGMEYIAPGIAFDRGTAVAFFEHESFSRFAAAMRDMHELGYMAPYATEFGEEPREDLYWGIQSQPDIFAYPDDSISFYPIAAPDVTSEKGALCISSRSEYKDECKQLLEWLFEDPEFANLVAYGIEGIQYKLDENGIARSISGGAGPDVLQPGLTGLFHLAAPCDDYYAGVSRRALGYMETLAATALTGFHFDDRGWEEVIANLDEIVKRYTEPAEVAGQRAPSLVAGNDPDWELTLKSLNLELSAAGIHGMINEVNRQYEAWKTLYSPAR